MKRLTLLTVGILLLLSVMAFQPRPNNLELSLSTSMSSSGTIADAFVLMETGDFILMETGDKILKE